MLQHFLTILSKPLMRNRWLLANLRVHEGRVKLRGTVWRVPSHELRIVKHVSWREMWRHCNCWSWSCLLRARSSETSMVPWREEFSSSVLRVKIVRVVESRIYLCSAILLVCKFQHLHHVHVLTEKSRIAVKKIVLSSKLINIRGVHHAMHVLKIWAHILPTLAPVALLVLLLLFFVFFVFFMTL